MAESPMRPEVTIQWIASDRFTDQETAGELLAGYDGLLVPGGFGVRGVEGMLEAIRWAREHKLPFFGICLGLANRDHRVCPHRLQDCRYEFERVRARV